LLWNSGCGNFCPLLIAASNLLNIFLAIISKAYAIFDELIADT